MPSPRGTSNSNDRGSAASRRQRKLWLLTTFGDGTYALCALDLNERCYGVVDLETVTIDRIIPGVLGGRYVRGNIRPACPPCNQLDGVLLRERLKHERRASGERGDLLAQPGG